VWKDRNRTHKPEYEGARRVGGELKTVITNAEQRAVQMPHRGHPERCRANQGQVGLLRVSSRRWWNGYHDHEESCAWMENDVPRPAEDEVRDAMGLGREKQYREMVRELDPSGTDGVGPRRARAQKGDRRRWQIETGRRPDT